MIDIEKMHGLGFDGINTKSSQRSGVQKRLRLHSPSAVYVHCRCHQLQLAAVNAADEHTEVKNKFCALFYLSARHSTILLKKQKSWPRYKLN